MKMEQRMGDTFEAYVRSGRSSRLSRGDEKARVEGAARSEKPVEMVRPGPVSQTPGAGTPPDSGSGSDPLSGRSSRP